MDKILIDLKVSFRNAQNNNSKFRWMINSTIHKSNLTRSMVTFGLSFQDGRLNASEMKRGEKRIRAKISALCRTKKGHVTISRSRKRFQRTASWAFGLGQVLKDRREYLRRRWRATEEDAREDNAAGRPASRATRRKTETDVYMLVVRAY